MMRLLHISILVVLAASIVSQTGCRRKGCTDPIACNFDENAKKDDESCDYQSCSNFRQEEMLTSYVDNVIRPGYVSLNIGIGSLKDWLVNFEGQPTVQQLANLQSILQSVWERWVAVEMYDFGPAADLSLKATMNTFPADAQQIADNIAAGNYDLNAAHNVDAIGLPALDYLLAGLAGSDTAIVELLSTDTLADARIEYIEALVEQMRASVEVVLQDWTNTYRTQFIEATGTDAGSSLSMLINSFNQDLEFLKNGRMGIPMGKKSLGEKFPEKVEALYLQRGGMLVRLHLRALRLCFQGQQFEGQELLGLDDYLVFSNAKYGENTLTEAIENQFELTENSASSLDSDLADAISYDSPWLEPAYKQVLELLVLTKSDMPSATGVLISYQDNDGD